MKGYEMTTVSGRGRALNGLAKAAAIAAVLIVGVAVFAHSRGGEKQPEPVSSSTEVSTQALQDYAERLSAYSTSPGYGDVSIDHAASAVTMYWKGTAPADVSKIVANPPAGIHAALRPADFSNAELVDAQHRVLEGSEPAVRIRIADVEATADRSGLIVNLTGQGRVSAADLESVAQVPVRVQYGASKPVTGPLAQ
jgi:hypothetical protein